jgi:hypothetical protein
MSWTGLVIGLALVGAPAALPVALAVVELILLWVLRRAHHWRDRRELVKIRRQLAELPETPHPLDRPSAGR